MGDKERSDPVTGFSSDDTSWTLADQDFFFGSSDRDSSSILGDFGWHIQPDNNSTFVDERSDLAGNISYGLTECSSGGGGGSGGVQTGSTNPAGSADVSTSNPSVSSSSSEDLTEKSTGSGGKPPEIP